MSRKLLRGWLSYCSSFTKTHRYYITSASACLLLMQASTQHLPFFKTGGNSLSSTTLVEDGCHREAVVAVGGAILDEPVSLIPDASPGWHVVGQAKGCCISSRVSITTIEAEKDVPPLCCVVAQAGMKMGETCLAGAPICLARSGFEVL
jgi:hypothetical protein